MPGPFSRPNFPPTILLPGREKNAQAVALDAPGFRIVLCNTTRTGVRLMSARESEAARIFLEAVEHHEPGQWATFVREAAAGDPLVLQRVDALLKAHGEPNLMLDGDRLVPTEDTPQPSQGPGTVIGPYKLLEQIGEGGFGVVFLAEQTVPVRRKVALKVLKPGMDTRQVIARFEAERQALAIMDHPHIAKVFDGGVTPSGRPFFVLELVKGVPVTEFCDQNHLSPRQRLELFLHVCHAVQHAHQKGIIHRDLKPSNVLVALHDGVPAVKVIDFGVAKALGQELTDKTLFTGLAQMIGTPLYMSPEQAGQSGLDIDTRSDIYSLGVLLYELLTGTTPFTKERFKQAAYDEIRRIIREEDPPKPSTRLSESKDSLPSISALRHTEPARLTRLVRGELDWIVMRALEKDRNRRYDTANGFALDVQRYLADEPVLACPPSVGYRFRKFARRNKRALVTAALLVAMLLVVAGGLGWIVSDRVARQVRMAGEVNQFLERAETLYADNKLPEAMAEVQKARGVLEAGGGDEELARQVRLWHTDLDTAAKLEGIRLEWYDLDDRIRGYADFARVFRAYGIDVEALPVEEATARVVDSQIKLDLVLALDSWAGQLRTDSLPQNPARWQRLRAISRAADPDPWRLRLYAAVEAKDVKTLRQLANGADAARLRTGTLAFLGDSLRLAGDVEAAVTFLRKAQRQHPSDFSINSTLAFCLTELKPLPLDEVIAFRRVALAVRPQSSWAHNALGVALRKHERLDEGILEYREAIRLRPKSAWAHYNLGNALRDQKKLDEAIASYRKAIEIDPKLAKTYFNLGNALRARQKLDEAVAAYRTAIELDPKNAVAHYGLGFALHQQKKLDEATASYRKAIEIDPKHYWAHKKLGNVLRGQKKLDEAIASYHKAIELDPKNAVAHYGLGCALHQQKKLDEAIASYRKAIEIDPKYVWAHINLGNALSKKGCWDEAAVCYRKAIELDPKYVRVRVNLGYALRTQNKLGEAVACYTKAIELDPKCSNALNGRG
jgi:serine/threonine protein kinase/tetratricopeptide (TPR) repeat protein